MYFGECYRILQCKSVYSILESHALPDNFGFPSVLAETRPAFVFTTHALSLSPRYIASAYNKRHATIYCQLNERDFFYVFSIINDLFCFQVHENLIWRPDRSFTCQFQRRCQIKSSIHRGQTMRVFLSPT